MDFINSDIKKLYVKYLEASLSGALVMSIYSFVDTMAVGQSEGPLGTAAMAVITPLYGFLTFLGIFCGVGGSVLLGNARGEGDEEKGNAYFTASLVLMSVLTLLFWVIFVFFHREIFTFFGADETILPKVMEYAQWLIRFFPAFILPIFISAFIRNDGSPNLAMAAVVVGGCVNIFGDWFLAFPMGMGMEGAAIATVAGSCLQVVIMCDHFFRGRCRLKLVKPCRMLHAFGEIARIGFGTSILDLGTVILVIAMNNQIMKYGSTTALAIYGVITTITCLFQALFCGVGQAVQPILSANCGARKIGRIKSVWNMSLGTVLILGSFFFAIGECFPRQIVSLFVVATPEVLAAAPGIIRPFFILFLFLGITVLSTYYLQSIMEGGLSMLVAVLRSIAVSGLLLWALPFWFDITGVWIALPVSEGLTAIIALFFIRSRKSSLYI